MTIQAKIIADSTANGVRLTTLQLKYPRFIHSEFMTHRVFSRNASSSRAIPVEKMLKDVVNGPAMPISWGINKSGMQASDVLSEHEVQSAEYEWVRASRSAKKEAWRMFKRYGLHKQIVNRIIEPFQHINVIVTATEWDNFFALRDHESAQPEIRELAKCMRKAMDESTPNELGVGCWHLPYLTEHERNMADTAEATDKYDWKKLSVARCARVSYLNHDQSNPDIEKDIALADKLLAMGHMSPFEHCYTPMANPFTLGFNRLTDPRFWEEGVTHMDKEGNLWSGNARSWVQYRQLV